MNSNIADLCHQAEVLVNDPPFLTVLVLEVLLGLPAMFVNFVLIAFVWKAKVFHVNLRCLLISHSFNLGLSSGATAIKAATFLFYGWQDPCGLVVSLYDCRCREIPIVVPLVSSMYDLLALSLERLYATIKYKTYDKSSTKPYLSIGMIIFIYILVLTNQLHPLPNLPKEKYMPLCESLLSIPSHVAGQVLAQNLSVNFVAIILAFALYFVNKRKLVNSIINRAQYSLTTRFQICQNVEVNQLLLPSMIGHTAITVPHSINLFLVSSVFAGLPQTTKFLWYQVLSLVCVILSIYHPILALVRNAHIRKALMAKLPIGWKRKGGDNKIEHYSTNMATAMHFVSLETMWNNTRTS